MLGWYLQHDQDHNSHQGRECPVIRPRPKVVGRPSARLTQRQATECETEAGREKSLGKEYEAGK